MAQYDKMLAAQGGKCAICKRPPKSRRLAVDHDHKTGKVRGLLCFRCNYRVVRKWKVDTLKAVLAYLEQSETAKAQKSQPAPRKGRGGGRK